MPLLETYDVILEQRNEIRFFYVINDDGSWKYF